jgi:cyclophilin family peptidyl-prolyl cis-trans isomerase
MKWFNSLVLALCATAPLAPAATIATFRTTVGTMEVELHDDTKPITVTNFINYVQRGKYTNLIVQRWETDFVIQAGGYYVTTNNSGGQTIDAVIPFNTITNEAGVGPFFENDYGTIAMARSQETNSAAGQWYFNLRDNPHLDTDKGGYTVFGRVISGTNVLNRFVGPIGSQGIYRVNLGGALATLPVLDPNPGYDDLIYMDISLRRNVGLKVAQGRTGKTIAWNSVPKYNNVVEYSDGFPMQWQVLTNVPGTGNPVGISDPSSLPSRIYRVKLLLP